LLVVPDMKLVTPNHSIGADKASKIIACFFLLVIWFLLKIHGHQRLSMPKRVNLDKLLRQLVLKKIQAFRSLIIASFLCGKSFHL